MWGECGSRAMDDELCPPTPMLLSHRPPVGTKACLSWGDQTRNGVGWGASGWAVSGWMGDGTGPPTQLRTAWERELTSHLLYR